MLNRRTFGAAAATLSLSGLVAAQATDYPRRPIKLMVGFAPGGSSDSTIRAFARELETQLGQPVVVENRAGATGLVALESFMQTPPDGYTVMMLSNVTLSALHMARKPLEMEKRFTPLAMFSATRVILIVNPKVMDVSNLQQFTEYVRQHPGTHYTTAGHGGLGHLGMELWARQVGVKLSHVAYRGTAPAMEDVLGGRVPAMVIDANAALPHVQSGAIRPIVTVSSQRSPVFPDLATALELGVSSLQIDGTIGLVAPAKTPSAVVDKLRAAIRRATDGESFANSSKASGAVKNYMDAPEYGPWLQKESDRWGRVIKESGLDQAARN